MWKAIERYVSKYHMFHQGDRVILGLSGGADSVLLARYLITLRDQNRISLYAVHVNHLLRQEEAVRDETFVVNFCEKWKIPYHIFHENVKQFAEKEKCSEEEAGRIVRYSCFKKCAKEWDCNKIALAHHATDLAETMIFRMIRGTGPSGLSGIHPVNGSVVRPLLCIDKNKIIDLLKQLEQDFVEDSTNASVEYSRNYIRHRILPYMCEMNDQAIFHLTQLAEQQREQNEYVCEQMDRLYKKLVTVRSETLASIGKIRLEACSDYEKKELIRRMIFQVSGHRKDVTSKHIDIVCDLLTKPYGKRVDLPYELSAYVNDTELIITKKMEGEPSDHFVCYRIDSEVLNREKHLKVTTESGDIYTFDIIDDFPHKNLKNNFVKYFDYDRIKKELCLRNRRPGDYFIMDRTGKKKMLNRYFIDEKIPVSKRDDILLLTQEDHVLWISGGRVSESFKLTKQTQHILRMEVNTL